MLDGSEEARFTFTSSGVELQSVDSMSVCTFLFSFARHRFLNYVIDSNGVVIRLKLRPLHNFMKKTSVPVFTFTHDVEGGLRISTPEKFGRSEERELSFNVQQSDDTSVYYALNHDMFAGCPCFRLNPEEFSNTVLDLSVGGGYINIEVLGGVLRWGTAFETGDIVITSRPHEGRGEYVVLRPAHEKISNHYLTKFFKQACSVTSTCTMLLMFIRQDGPVLLQFSTESEVSGCLVSIVPVKNTRDRQTRSDV